MENSKLGHEVGSSLAAQLLRKQPSHSRTSLCTTVEAKTKENGMNEVVTEDCFSKFRTLSQYILGLPCTPPDICHKITCQTGCQRDCFAPAVTWVLLGAFFKQIVFVFHVAFTESQNG